jgi:hypothetical protein
LFQKKEIKPLPAFHQPASEAGWQEVDWEEADK